MRVRRTLPARDGESGRLSRSHLVPVQKVSASGFTTWRDRKPSRRTIENTRLTEQIRSVQVASDSTDGRDRVRAEPRDQDVQANHKRIARRMRLAGMRGVRRRRGFVLTARREPGPGRAPDLVPHQCKAMEPHPLWVADRTDVPTWAGFLFLAVGFDVGSRRVVGGSIGEHLRAELVLAALHRAIPLRKPDAATQVQGQLEPARSRFPPGPSDQPPIDEARRRITAPATSAVPVQRPAPPLQAGHAHARARAKRRFGPPAALESLPPSWRGFRRWRRIACNDRHPGEMRQASERLFRRRDRTKRRKRAQEGDGSA